MGDRALGLEADKCSSGKESWPLQTWEVPGLSSCVKIAGADSWESGLWGSSSCCSQRSWCGGSPSECGALECADTSRLAPPRAPGVSEPFHKHLPWLSAQTECFRSVKRGRRERSSCGLPLASQWPRGAWRVTGHCALTTALSPACCFSAHVCGLGG